MKNIIKIAGLVGVLAAATVVAKKIADIRSVGHGERTDVTPVKFDCQPINHHSWSWKRFFREQPVAPVLIVLIVLSIALQGVLGRYSFWIKTSLVRLEPTPFVGTTMPIKQVPNWVNLTDAQRVMNWEDLPSSKKMALPAYNLSAMKRGQVWRPNNESDRNTYITYPVPNLGNYELDATENSGSHTGVDIKTLVGTPVHAIADGIVWKAEYQATGFGRYVVIAHVGVPDPDVEGQTTTLYSVYAHMSSYSVRAGQKVSKNDVIGKTGMSGMATAPHLHFQIDRMNAPFHPYWPFTWKDLSRTRITSYFEAVRQGFNKSNAIKYTVHPILFSEKFVSYSPETADLVASAGTTDHASVPVIEKPTLKIDDTPAPTPVDKVEIVSTPPIATGTRPAIKPVTNPSREVRNVRRSGSVDFEVVSRTFVPGEPKIVKFVVDDEQVIEDTVFEISSTLRSNAYVTPPTLTAQDFENGVAEVRVQTDSQSMFRLVASADGMKDVKSDAFRAQVFSDVEPGHAAEQALISLKNRGVIRGKDGGNFDPNGALNRAEAVKLLIESNEITLLPADLNFSDVDGGAWYAPYVRTALARGIVRGYADGTFLPSKSITRAEFLKLALETGNINVSEIAMDPYGDVPADSWFGKYVRYATKHGLIEPATAGFFGPHSSITRAEAAIVMYELNQKPR